MSKRTLREVLEKYAETCWWSFQGYGKIDQAEAEIRAQSKEIMDLAWNFIIDARGSWETGEGNRCLDLIEKYRKEVR